MNKLTQSQVESAKNLSCEMCKCEVMKQGFVIKTVSGLLTGNSKDTFIPVPVFACMSCNHVNKIFSQELKLSDKSSDSIQHVQV
jgi:hypothetical protein